MTIAWSRSLSTGVDEIDEQHKALFERIDAVMKMASRETQTSNEEIYSVIRFLEGYAQDHFLSEEKRMADSGYPALNTHRAQHKEFMTSLAEIKRAFVAKGACTDVATLISEKLASWLRNHISISDRLAGAHIVASGKK